MKHKPNSPINVYFQSVFDRKDFMLLFYNFKRMFHENHVHHELYASYRHDTKRAIVCWLVAAAASGAGPGTDRGDLARGRENVWLRAWCEG